MTNSSDVASGRDGIRLDSAHDVACNDNIVRGNVATDTQQDRTQTYGVAIRSGACQDTVVGNNDLGGNESGELLDRGTATLSDDSSRPSAPTTVSVAATGRARVDVGWSASQDDDQVAGYTIYRNERSIATVTDSVLAYRDTDVSAGREYAYGVEAFDRSGNVSDRSALARVVTAGEPGTVEPPAPEPVDPNACTIEGTSGDDVLVGTPGDDVICGLAGNDVLRGLGGNDRLKGGAGSDRLLGGDGADDLRGGRGADQLRGAAGADVLKGGRGPDILRGGAADDKLYGGKGRDRLAGNSGSDRLTGGTGEDLANGGRGNDRCDAERAHRC